MPGSYSKKSYTSASFTTTDYGKFWDQSNVMPWKPRVLIYDHTGTQLLHEYDSFQTDNDLKIQAITTEYQQGSTGTFNLTIDDRGRTLDPKQIGHSNKVVIAICKRDNGDWRNICSGYVYTVEPTRDVTSDGLKYNVSGYGSGIVFAETLTNFQKLNTRPILGSANAASYDAYMQVNNLATSLITETDHLDNDNDLSIQERGQFLLDGISPRVRDLMHDFSVRHTPASSVMNALTDSSGSYWGVDAYDTVYLKYPWEGNTAITLKTMKAADKDTDNINNTSYFYGPWKYTTNSNSQSGFANVLISTSGSDPKPVLGEQKLTVPNPDSCTPLHNCDICQRFNLTIPDLHFISILLKRVGVMIEKFLTGHIYVSIWDDLKQCHVPNFRAPVGSFKIKCDDIPADYPHPVFCQIQKQTKQIPTGDNYWIALHQCGQDVSNCVYWFHDSKPNNDRDPRCGRRFRDPKQPPDHEGLPQFNTDPILPTYTYATYYNVKTKIIIKDPVSCLRFGEVESYVDLSQWTTDFKTVCKTLMQMLRYTSRPAVIYDTAQITIPDPPLQPGDRVYVVDDASGLTQGTNTVADILRVRYNFQTGSIESSVGGYLCDVSVQGLYDFLAIEGLPDQVGMPVPEELSYDLFVT